MAADAGAHEGIIASRLVERGFARMRAAALAWFVPVGLARAVIKRIPADPPIKFAETVLIKDEATNREFEVNLSEVPEFVTAVEIGEEEYATGFIAREDFKEVSLRSAE